MVLLGGYFMWCSVSKFFLILSFLGDGCCTRWQQSWPGPGHEEMKGRVWNGNSKMKREKERIRIRKVKNYLLYR